MTAVLARVGVFGGLSARCAFCSPYSPVSEHSASGAVVEARAPAPGPLLAPAVPILRCPFDRVGLGSLTPKGEQDDQDQ